jgi:hypothetical protein
LVESLILPSKAGTSSGSAVSSDSDSTPSSNPVFRGMAYAFVFEVMVAISCYSAWLAFGTFRHH